MKTWEIISWDFWIYFIIKNVHDDPKGKIISKPLEVLDDDVKQDCKSIYIQKIRSIATLQSLNISMDSSRWIWECHSIPYTVLTLTMLEPSFGAELGITTTNIAFPKHAKLWTLLFHYHYVPPYPPYPPFNFVIYAHWQSSTRWSSQILLEVREERLKI